MKRNINIYDFNFECAGYGHYKVTYTSPKTGKKWSATIDNMPLIDATKKRRRTKKTKPRIFKKNSKKCKLNNLSNKSGNVKDLPAMRLQ